ncbi:hypothetical protein PVAND_004745 [Polypedilum vanderplanki]|uniref:glutathione transferase n=1 Tax=Polypedilum vanderplanki TaxID=319348 RepID=A0A9J6BZ12_POLVA|nr:hypothetical protein PVAND_004745 [Polypedilum vanderplanki]
MKLYHTPGSPPSRSVLMTLRCLEIDVEIHEIDLRKGENRTADFLKINPLGQIPVLDDGFILTESRAIMTYLANSRKNEKLYPSDPRKRAIVDSRLYFDATGLFVHIFAALSPMFFKGTTEVTPEVREKLKNALKYLEGILEKQKFFAGDEATLADISILSTVVQIKNTFGGLGNFSNLKAWFERCNILPGYDENLVGAQMIKEFFEKATFKIAPLE